MRKNLLLFLLFLVWLLPLAEAGSKCKGGSESASDDILLSLLKQEKDKGTIPLETYQTLKTKTGKELKDGFYGALKRTDEAGGVVNGAGKLTLNQIDDWVKFATMQNDKPKVMFGMWDGGGANSYINKAGIDYTYFDFENKWDEIYNLVNKSDDEIWKINKEFIDRQKTAGKEFWFSHDPFSPKNEQFFAREVNYLIDL